MSACWFSGAVCRDRHGIVAIKGMSGTEVGLLCVYLHLKVKSGPSGGR